MSHRNNNSNRNRISSYLRLSPLPPAPTNNHSDTNSRQPWIVNGNVASLSEQDVLFLALASPKPPIRNSYGRITAIYTTRLTPYRKGELHLSRKLSTSSVIGYCRLADSRVS